MTRSPYISKLLHRQRGVVVIWFALLLPVLLGFAALAVDLARLGTVKAELQNAADAAALGGARSLSDPGGEPYNWSAATVAAEDFARRNSANAARIRDVAIETGYWNLPDPSLGLRDTLTTPVAGDLPAVQVTVAITSTRNNGPLRFFFAPFLGIDDSDIQASATAVLPAPEGGTGMFPFAFNDCILSSLWDSDTNSPVLDGSGDPIIFRIQDPYPDASCYAGEWTTFDTPENNVPAIRDLMDDGNTTPLSVGDPTWILPGTKATLYQKVKNEFIGKEVPIVVVDNIPGKKGWQTITAIIGFKITGASHQGKNKYVEGHFISNELFGGLNPGSGNGTPLGAYTPPVLVR